MESIEVSGRSVDDAVLQALVRLHKRRDEVEVTVLQEPSRGRFGIGSTDARIRVTVLSPRGGAVLTPEMADALLGPDDEELDDEELDDEELEDDELEDEELDEEEMEEVIEMLRVLNAYDKRRTVDVPDYDSRPEGFPRCVLLI